MKKAVTILISTVVVGMMVFWIRSDREETTSANFETDQGEFDRLDQDVIDPQGQPISHATAAGTVSSALAVDDEEAGSLGSETPQPESPNSEGVSFFFVTERDFIRVHMYWLRQSARYGSEWSNRLESELSRDDSALNSGDLEQAAAYAVIKDPSWSYDPPLSASDLMPSCRNHVCKVEIPASVRVTKDQMAVTVPPGSILNSSARVQFSHGFFYHIVLQKYSTNTTTHYYLANGFELNEPD